MPGVIGEDDDVAGEVRVMRAADAGVAYCHVRNRNDLHVHNGLDCVVMIIVLVTGFSSIRLIMPTSTR